ncbi:hypothetical protein JCM14719A_00140 [Calditerricola satsumensis]|uniref:CN hydrolase domain-containing protein n=2 Tax=Calditerricola satsumensis TaxID=373054 RepID=A0A8J3BFI0_9BACI|nr:hypothetical protein GCM10007043_21270 [Calditerricola satsumensis]
MMNMRMRVAAVQYALRSIRSVDEFAAQVTHYVRTAQEFGAEVVLFPEFFTTQLLSIGDGRGNALPIDALPDFTEAYRRLFGRLARETGMLLIGGTHVVRRGDHLYNVAHLFFPDGRVAEQAKLHLTPTEVREWKLAPGDALHVFDTEKGKIAVLICYDVEFPELARMARARGANVIFCPSCTDNEPGFWRVRYTCHARAVENQVYVVNAGTVGSLPTVDFMRANYGQAAVIAPNDIPFPPRGVVAEGVVGDDMVVVADLDLDLLEEVRARGAVTTWRDRRTDLYPDWA